MMCIGLECLKHGRCFKLNLLKFSESHARTSLTGIQGYKSMFRLVIMTNINVHEKMEDRLT